MDGRRYALHGRIKRKCWRGYVLGLHVHENRYSGRDGKPRDYGILFVGNTTVSLHLLEVWQAVDPAVEWAYYKRLPIPYGLRRDQRKSFRYDTDTQRPNEQ